ncbi:HEPN domain-containing protein [Paenibacillus polymyxa]|uniref:HEPN domain-containing protein n=1 Tax=Paenibacillus polymyxa TaxID=1406 RepID=UPI002023F1D6|nr:HEPN domain-containing protein [Paenibacillus polymyxa]URJ44477.3 HEPN domain-containing protein [Paenibacillus polymyxa]
MPSYSCRDYRRRTIDVQKLSKDYKTLRETFNKKGRVALDHLTRSGVLLLCGAWETYIEDILREISTHFATLSKIDELPREVKKTIIHYVKNHKQEDKVLELADGGWKNLYLDEIVEQKLEGFNTPKVHNIKEISKKLIGYEEIMDCLTPENKDFINQFVQYRGYIAHNVRSRGEQYLTVEKLDEYVDDFETIVNTVDNHLLNYLKPFVSSRLWNRVNE